MTLNLRALARLCMYRHKNAAAAAAAVAAAVVAVEVAARGKVQRLHR